MPLTGGNDVFRAAAAAPCAAARFVPLLADRDLTGGGVEVDLCGEPARMAVGPAALAVATGAALHPVSIHYEPAAGCAAAAGTGSSSRFHDRVPVPAARQRRATRSQR